MINETFKVFLYNIHMPHYMLHSGELTIVRDVSIAFFQDKMNFMT